MEVRDACRTNCRPLIVFYGESGTGKTLSALLLARGLAGDDGKLIMVETENGRGEAYVDVLQPLGNPYKIVSLSEPFTPQRHVEALETAERAGAKAIILDSGSHEWEGIGGVLSQAAAIEEKSGKAGLHCWNKPKFHHALFVAKLMRCVCPVVVCLRAKYKSRQIKNAQGKTEIVRDDYSTPLQDGSFLFEATVHAEIQRDHTLHVTKLDEYHPELSAFFPEGQRVTVEHGRGLAQWCKMVGAPPKPAGPPKPTAKKQAWDLAMPKHLGSAHNFRQWLVDEMFIPDDQPLEKIPSSQWDQLLPKIKNHLENQSK